MEQDTRPTNRNEKQNENEKIAIGATVALPSGLIAIVSATAGENLLLQFPGRPISFLHPRGTVRFLSSTSYHPLIVEPEYLSLIERRNKTGLDSLTGRTKKPAIRRGAKAKMPKEKSLQQLILACTSPAELLALLASKGLNPEKKEVKQT